MMTTSLDQVQSPVPLRGQQNTRFRSTTMQKWRMAFAENWDFENYNKLPATSIHHAPKPCTAIMRKGYQD